MNEAKKDSEVKPIVWCRVERQGVHSLAKREDVRNGCSHNGKFDLVLF